MKEESKKKKNKLRSDSRNKYGHIRQPHHSVFAYSPQRNFNVLSLVLTSVSVMGETHIRYALSGVLDLSTQSTVNLLLEISVLWDMAMRGQTKVN
jgi:hypothetical protein